MKLKKVVASMLAIMTMATGAMSVTASAANDFTFSLRAGESKYTGSYATNNSSYGSVKATSGVSQNDYCKVAFCDENHNAITSSEILNTYSAINLTYTSKKSYVCLRGSNTQSSKTVTGRLNAAGSL